MAWKGFVSFLCLRWPIIKRKRAGIGPRLPTGNPQLWLLVFSTSSVYSNLHRKRSTKSSNTSLEKAKRNCEYAHFSQPRGLLDVFQRTITALSESLHDNSKNNQFHLSRLFQGPSIPLLQNCSSSSILFLHYHCPGVQITRKC